MANLPLNMPSIGMLPTLQQTLPRTSWHRLGRARSQGTSRAKAGIGARSVPRGGLACQGAGFRLHAFLQPAPRTATLSGGGGNEVHLVRDLRRGPLANDLKAPMQHPEFIGAPLTLIRHSAPQSLAPRVSSSCLPLRKEGSHAQLADWGWGGVG